MALYAEGKDEFWKNRQEAFTKRKKGTAEMPLYTKIFKKEKH